MLAREARAGLLTALTLGSVAFPAAAQVWVDDCSGCHGAPPNVAATVSDGSGSLTLGLGEAFMASAVTLRNRVNAAGPGAGAAVMTNLTQPQANAVHAYLLQVRDGAVTNFAPTFSSTAVNTTSTSPSFNFTISNFRNQASTYTLDRSGTHASEFTVNTHSASGAGCSAGNVPAATSVSASTCIVTVTLNFSPLAAGTRTASLTVDVTTPSGPQPSNERTVALSATAFTPTPGFQISTTTLNFTAKLGAAVTQSVTITNPGSATANLVLGSLVYSPAQYSRAGSSTCNVATSLAPGASCTLTTSFAPAVVGSTPGTLTINHNAAGSPQAVTLNGTGTQALIDPTAATLAFANVQVGVPRVLNQVVSNTGTGSLVFSVEPSAGSARTGAAKDDYAVTGNCQVASPIAPANSCTLTVTFTPAALGARPATLTISSDATNGPLVIDLTGTGVALPEPVVTYPATDFPDTVIGESAAQTRTITIRNDRTRDITYSVAGVTDFGIGTESCAGRVVPGGGGTCMVAVQFQPTLGSGEGLRQGTIGFTFAGTGGDIAPSNATGNVAGRALLPLAQSASTLNAAAVVGSPGTASMLLTNRASTPLTLSALAFGGANAAEFTLDATNGCTAGIVLAASANCTLVVRFAPAAPGARTAALTLTHSKPGSPQNVTLQGTATPAPQGRIELGSLALAFPNTQFGSSSTQNVIVRNSGDLTLTFSAFTIGGPAAAEFERGGDCSAAAPLAIGAQCTLTVTFRPAATLGVRSASLTIASDASNGPATLSLAGTAIAVPVPVVSLAPASLDFGVQTAGGLYPARRIRVANSGTADLAISAIAVQGSGFANVSAAACPPVLLPGAGCDIDIALVTTEAIPYSGTLRVTSNAAGSPHTASLTGSGSAGAVAVLTWSPLVTSLDFGAVSAGSLSAVQSVNVLNQGPGGVNLTVLNAVGPDAAAFSVVGGTCAIGTPLFQGDTCRIDIRFAPGTAGNKSASVQVASTGSFPPTLSLAGVGLGGPSPSLALSASSLAFGATRVGADSLPAELRLTSNGSSVVRVTALDVTGAYAMHGSTCPALPFTLAAGTDCTLTLSFRPSGEGASAGMLRVTSDSDPAIREVALSGSGEAAADVSGGGCSIGSGTSLLDPTLWLLVLLAIGTLIRRRQRTGGRTNPGGPAQ